MKRLIAAAALLLSATLTPAAALAAGLPAQLKPVASVEGDVIRLGDIWDNAGDKAQVAIANAPQPGKRVTLDARWLAAVAAAHGLDWRPANIFEKSVLERAGTKVDMALIETELKEALAMEGLPANSGFDISNRAALDIAVPAGSPNTVAVRDVTYDARTQRFGATVEAPAGAPTAQRIRITGRTWTTTRVPALIRAMNRGQVITERDLDWVEMRETNRRDLVLDASQLVGMEPRYQLRAGQPIRSAELQRPLMVNRNQVVTMVMKTPFMTLSAQGRAAEDGGKGDLIRVTNLQTKQIVEAVIEAPGRVSVAGGGRALSN